MGLFASISDIIKGMSSKPYVDYSTPITPLENLSDVSTSCQQTITQSIFATHKQCLLLKAIAHQMVLQCEWIDFYVQPFEAWIPSSILKPIRNDFLQIINNEHGDFFEKMIEARYSLNDDACAEIYSIQNLDVRFAADEAYQEMLLSDISREFRKQCDITLKEHLPRLCEIAESILYGKRTEQNQRDLDREKLLVNRAKLTMIEDYLNSKA